MISSVKVFDIETLLDIKNEARVLSRPLYNLLEHRDDETSKLIRMKDVMVSPLLSLSIGRIPNEKCIELIT